MIRSFVLVVLVVGLTASAPAQSPPSGPRISLGASGGGGGQGTASVSGTVSVPAPWQLSIYTVTIRFQKDGGTKTLNIFIPVKDDKFFAKVNLKAGSYKAWAVIDVKDADGREKQISSEPKPISVQ